MDETILFLHENLFYVIAFTGLIVLAKFVAGVIYYRGNVVDSIVRFFSFYSSSNIQMTEGNGSKALKRANNLFNVLIYLLVVVFITFHFIYPHILG